MPSFKCSDTGMNCPFETSAATEAELMDKIAKHASEAHGMKTIPPARCDDYRLVSRKWQAETRLSGLNICKRLHQKAH